MAGSSLAAAQVPDRPVNRTAAWAVQQSGGSRNGVHREPVGGGGSTPAAARSGKAPGTAGRPLRRGLPSPASVAGGIAMALLEVEAGCRSAVQLERVCAPELWAGIEHRLERRGGPLPSGRALLRVVCQEDLPGL